METSIYNRINLLLTVRIIFVLINLFPSPGNQTVNGHYASPRAFWTKGSRYFFAINRDHAVYACTNKLLNVLLHIRPVK